MRRTIGIAKSSAWTTGVFGGITCLGVLLGDITSLILGTALIAVAVREGSLARRLARFDVSAPAALAVNQLVLGGIILLYSASQIWIGLHAPGHAGTAHGGGPKVDDMLGDIEGLTRRITVGLYVAVGIGGALATLFMAWVYRRRERSLREFVMTTEPWVLEVMRKAA